MKIRNNIKKALGIEGATTELSLFKMGRLLTNAIRHHPDGLCFEFGTYIGRGSALLASNLNENSWPHALEQSYYFEIDPIKKIVLNVSWHKLIIKVFCKNKLEVMALGKHIVFTHNVPINFFDNVVNELDNVVKKVKCTAS